MTTNVVTPTKRVSAPAAAAAASCRRPDATGAAVTITGASGSDSNVVAGTIDGTSVIFTLSVNGDTNNFLVDIDGDGDSAGHTYIHTHTGSIADVDITQSGIYDNMITLTTSGDNHNIDIIQRD